jgi:putative FmdB family regulatory protein
MPVYQYHCRDCGVRFERTQSFKDAPLTLCPECEGEVYRVIGATGIIFKGSGFYATDNRKSNGPASTKNDKDEKSVDGEAASKSETKTSESSSRSESASPAASNSTSSPAASTAVASST